MSTTWTIALAAKLGGYLSSRRAAATLRKEIVSQIEKDGSVCQIDFADVWSVSDSFSDELLSILVVERGHDWFRQHIKLINLSDDLRTSILRAIDQRLSRVA
jgi:hypothetical protein